MNCPQCGQTMVERSGKFGPFLACSGYPECRYIHKTPRSGERRGAPTAPPPPTVDYLRAEVLRIVIGMFANEMRAATAAAATTVVRNRLPDIVSGVVSLVAAADAEIAKQRAERRPS